MINWNIIKRCLVSWVTDNAMDSDGDSLQLGHVIWEDQSDQRPDGEYASLKILIGPKRLGHDVLLNATPDFTMSGLREFTLSVNLYRDKAIERASNLLSRLHVLEVLESFQASGLVYISETDVRDLTRAVGSRFEKRFQFDVRFRLAENNTTNPGVIEEVNATGTVTGSIGPDTIIELSVLKP